MSLQTDRFFYHGLRQSDKIKAIVGNRIFNPARPTADEIEDRIPYIIISFEGLTNNAETKDDEVEGQIDNVTISVMCVESSCDTLGTLTELVRDTMCQYWRDNYEDKLTPFDWNFSASQVLYDPDKPCCFQTLTYQCQTEK